MASTRTVRRVDAAAAARVAAAKGVGRAGLKRILARLGAGESKQAIRRDERLSYERVDAIARAAGWKRSWLAKSVWEHRRFRTLDVAEILARFDRGETLQAIGRRAGVTRERVRQIVRDAGRTPRRVAQRPLVAARRRERERERRQRRIERRAQAVVRRRDADARLAKQLGRANELWRAGRSISEIARAYRLPPNSMGWYIFTARARLGGGWFPRRVGVRKTG